MFFAILMSDGQLTTLPSRKIPGQAGNDGGRQAGNDRGRLSVISTGFLSVISTGFLSVISTERSEWRDLPSMINCGIFHNFLYIWELGDSRSSREGRRGQAGKEGEGRNRANLYNHHTT